MRPDKSGGEERGRAGSFSLVFQEAGVRRAMVTAMGLLADERGTMTTVAIRTGLSARRSGARVELVEVVR